MASNFRILLQQKSDNLHVKLCGDFDGSSAYELIHAIKNLKGNPRNIYIHTSRLSCLYPFGLDVFKKNWNSDNLTHSLTFTGLFGNKLASVGSRII